MVDDLEARQRLVQALLGAEGPLGALPLARAARLPDDVAEGLLRGLVGEERVVAGRLDAAEPGILYRWADHWRRNLGALAERRRQALRERVLTAEPWNPAPPEPTGGAATAFAGFVCGEYRPPADKRVLVLLQCSVRRPFSSSPSHASMRRAVRIATGWDPGHDFERCPVHVVVLASRIGPVPYELETVHPATVSCEGVKRFNPEEYARIGPILVERMARYLDAHREAYDRVVAFAEGRYGEVIARAAEASGVPVRVTPHEPGPRVVRVGRSRPRKYWEVRWIQLTLALLEALPPEAHAQAEARLAAEGIEWADE